MATRPSCGGSLFKCAQLDGRYQLKAEGPIPTGTYTFEIFKKRDITTRPFSHGIKNPGWGDAAWELSPEPGTETYGRTGMFVHGGWEWGSAGYIDLRYSEDKLADFLSDVKKECDCGYVTVIVKYAKEKVTKTEQTMLPYLGWLYFFGFE